MSIDENKALVLRFFALGPSQGGLSAAGELLANDFARHVPGHLVKPFCKNISKSYS